MLRFGMPPDWSLDGHRIDALIGLANGLVAFYFVIVVAALATMIVVFRRRPGRKVAYFDGSRRRDVWLATALSALVFVSVDVNLEVHADLDLHRHFWNFPKPEEALRVEIMPQQWAWNIRYPGPDGKFGTADDVVTLNDLRFPVGKPVLARLMSKDVIHSFTLPFYRVKVDANPGSMNEVWWQPEKPGTSEIACSQMCGWAHYKMRGTATAMEPADFDRWYAEAAAEARAGYDPKDTIAHWGWNWSSTGGDSPAGGETGKGTANVAPSPAASPLAIVPRCALASCRAL